MSYRPEGWENLCRDYIDELGLENRYHDESFEAGADAMLEGLRKRGFLDMGSRDNLDIHGVYDKPLKFTADCFGKLALIPDDE